ncbi:MAG: hypothetical protein DRM98_00170 [Thermoplasmata archaeon]|nr:MAG: hypothetical protein DRM98_00170 [Thermoplasmata archaeon]
MRRAVSAIVGVILMIAIVITVAVIVFVYINDLQQPVKEQYVTGWVVYSAETNQTLNLNNKTVSIWNVSLADEYHGTAKNTYQMCFIEGMCPPPLDVHLKFFYYKIDDVLMIYKIKSL